MKSLTILPLADTPNLIVREIESYDVKAFSGIHDAAPLPALHRHAPAQ